MKPSTMTRPMLALLTALLLAGFQVGCSDDAPLEDKTATSQEDDATTTDAGHSPGDAQTGDDTPDSTTTPAADAGAPPDTHTGDSGGDIPDTTQEEPDATEQPQPDTSSEPDSSGEPDTGSEPDASSEPDSSSEPDTSGEPSSNCATGIVQDLFALVNASRAAEGRGPLSCDEGLGRAAQLHAEDMCALNYFSHTSDDGRTFDQRIRAQGVSAGAMAENIAAGSSTAAQVHQRWMNSPGHRANIMNGQYQRMGVGFKPCSTAQYSHYWVETFAD